MRKPIVGVMGAGRFATDADRKTGYALGKLIAERGWVLLSGGTAKGVMDESCRGAQEAGGLVVGIIAGKDASNMSKYVDIPVFTGLMSGRNVINALSSDVVIACGGMVAGTLSEIALTLREDRPVVLLSDEADTKALLGRIGGDLVHMVDSPEQAVEIAAKILEERRGDKDSAADV